MTVGELIAQLEVLQAPIEVVFAFVDDEQGSSTWITIDAFTVDERENGAPIVVLS